MITCGMAIFLRFLFIESQLVHASKRTNRESIPLSLFPERSNQLNVLPRNSSGFRDRIAQIRNDVALPHAALGRRLRLLPE